MPLPQTIAGYEAEWSILAHNLTQQNTWTLELKSPKLAKTLRFRFYGFRRALMKHDPSNPWIAALMETQATITPEGNLHFERNPYAAVLRGLLEHSIVQQQPGVETKKDNSVGMSNSDQTILDMLSKKDN